MQRLPQSTKRTVAFATLALGSMLTLTACGGASSASPEQIFKDYIAALNEGDFATALGMVQDTGEIAPADIIDLDGFTFDEPLLRGEPLSSDIESGTLSMDLQGTAVSVDVVKRDGAWMLAKPVALNEFDLTGPLSTLDKFAQVGVLSIRTAAGEPMPLTGYTLSGTFAENTAVTVSLTDGLVPDQEFEASNVSLIEGWSGDGINVGDLPDAVAGLADELAFVGYHLDATTNQYVTQRGTIEFGECTNDYRYSEFVLNCTYAPTDTDLEGKPFLIAGDSGAKAQSTFDNLGGISVRSMTGCYYYLGASPSAYESYNELKIVIKDGEATVLWGYELEESDGFEVLPSANVLDQERVSEECSGWNPDREGSIIEGLVPRESDEEGTRVSITL